MHKEVPWIYM